MSPCSVGGSSDGNRGHQSVNVNHPPNERAVGWTFLGPMDRTLDRFKKSTAIDCNANPAAVTSRCATRPLFERSFLRALSGRHQFSCNPRTAMDVC
jgi:hypothetical protein